jgi:N utilization substance protein A
MAEQIDIMSAIRQIAVERKIDIDDIINAIKQAVATVVKKENEAKGIESEVEVEFDPDRGYIGVSVEKTVVKKVKNPDTEVSLSDAKSIKKTAKEGDVVMVDITPEGDFGRIAAQTVRQVILQKLREAEKDAAIKQIEDLIGTIDVVVVQGIDPKTGDVICEINKARAVMSSKDRIPSEFYRLGSRIKVLLKSIEEDPKGKFVKVSRSDPDFLKELFRAEVPEIDSESIEIVAIAREAGSRSKVAVKSNAPGIDPIGSCVGQKGVRINTITNELKSGMNEEKIDIILWDDDIQTFLMNAIRPAESIKVEIKDKKEKQATIVVPDEQYSLAIGRDGQNARLAAKLTGWTIDIQSENGPKKEEENEVKE